MTIEDRKKDSIEKLSENLYRNDGTVTKHRHGVLHKRHYDVSDDWSGEGNPPKRPIDRNSTFKKFFIGSIVFFFSSVIFALYTFYGGFNIVSNENISLSVLGPAFTEGGSDLNLQFEIKNSNRQALEYADLIIEYPRGATLLGDKDIVRLTKSIGNIGSGKSASENIKIVIFGDEDSERIVKATLEYRLEGSNAIFLKETTFPVHVKSSPISISVSDLREVNANQEISIDVEMLANSDKVLRNMLLRIEYPAGFTLLGTTPEATYGNNVWRLGDFDKLARKKITIRGKLTGEDGEERSFRIYGGQEDEKDREAIGIIYGSVLETLTIKRPFIETKLLINGESGTDFVIPTNGRVNGELVWVNNLPDRMLDAELFVLIEGDAIDKKTVSVFPGFFNSQNNTIMWNKDTVPMLEQIQGGDGGSFSFTFNVLPAFSGNRVILKNPELTLEAGVSARRVKEGNVPEKITSSEKKVVRVSSNVQLSSFVRYYDGPFKNSGGLPPRADKETTYTITWTVLNSSNNLSNTLVKTTLPSYVRFLGNISPNGEEVSFNDKSREIIWNIGSVDQGVGVDGPIRQLSFQIGLTASLSQVGNSATVMGESLLTTKDTFTNANITVTKNMLTTRLSGDTGIKAWDDIVSK
ncbi:MAG: hypothetical protein AAB488_01385 [Patescibacteria group bacterium]